MDTTGRLLTEAHAIYSRASNETSHPADNKDKRPPVYKGIGIALAIASGVFIGTSFVLKKTGLLRANVKYNEEAGEGYGYLKNTFWWTGMTLMIIGEICNFVAYGFVDAILVTPLGALSVVLTTILSAIFLKERLSFVGKVGCFMCIIGSVVIVLNAPEQSRCRNNTRDEEIRPGTGLPELRRCGYCGMYIHCVVGWSSIWEEKHACLPQYMQSHRGVECCRYPRSRSSCLESGPGYITIQRVVPVRSLRLRRSDVDHGDNFPQRKSSN